MKPSNYVHSIRARDFTWRAPAFAWCRSTFPGRPIVRCHDGTDHPGGHHSADDRGDYIWYDDRPLAAPAPRAPLLLGDTELFEGWEDDD